MLEKAYIETKQYQYLYADNDNIVLMNKEDFTQENVSKKLLEEKFHLLEEEMALEVKFFENKT